jgi:hypothetical protein
MTGSGIPLLRRTGEFERCLKWYRKKKPKELESVLNNLDTLVKSMDGGKPLKPFAYGFLSSEPSDVVRIKESGNSGLAATRLYVYHEVATDTLYLLTIGDKNTQGEDIELGKEFVKEITADANSGSDEDDGPDQDRSGDGIQAPSGEGPDES